MNGAVLASGERRLAAIAIAMLALSIAGGLLVPIYTDEIGWKLNLARWWSDGVVQTNYPMCGAGHAVAPPLALLPFRALDSLLYGDLRAVWRLRALGIVQAALTAAVLLLGLPAATPGAPPHAARAVAASLLGLGVLPLLLGLNRPETPLLCGALLLALAPGRAWAERRPTAVRAAAVVVVSLGTFAAHPKGVLFAPLAAVAAWRLSGAAWARAASLAAVAAGLAAAVRHWDLLFAHCDDARIGAVLRANMMAPAALLAHPGAALGAALAGLTDAQFGLVALVRSAQLTAAAFPQSWLALPLPAAPATLAAGLAGAAWLASALVAAAGLTGAAGAWRRREAYLAPFLAAGASLAALLLLEVQRRFYDATLLLPLLALCAVLALRVLRISPRAMRAAAVAAVTIAALNQAVLWSGLIRAAPALVVAGGPLTDQPLSVGAWRYAAIAPEITAAAAPCGLDLTAPQESLIVDDVTYPLLSAIVRRPLPALYLNRYWFPDDAQLRRVLAARRAAGMLVDCRFTPSALAARAIRSGRFCCLGAAALADAPAAMP